MRAPPGDHWEDTLPSEVREQYRAAWNAFRACRDCRHWLDDGEGVGGCGRVTKAAFIVPEDYTCEDFEPKRTQ